MATSTTRISLSDIAKELELHRAQVKSLRDMVTRYGEGLTTDVIRGVEPAVRNTYVLRNAIMIETYIDAALNDLQSASVFVKTFQRKEQEDAD
jgi:hypothetical protein